MSSRKIFINITILAIVALILTAFTLSKEQAEVVAGDICGQHGELSGEVCLCDYHFDGKFCEECSNGYSGEDCKQCDGARGFAQIANQPGTCAPLRASR